MKCRYHHFELQFTKHIFDVILISIGRIEMTSHRLYSNGKL